MVMLWKAGGCLGPWWEMENSQEWEGHQDSLSQKTQLNILWSFGFVLCFFNSLTYCGWNHSWFPVFMIWLFFKMVWQGCYLVAESSLWAHLNRFDTITQEPRAPGGSVEGVCIPFENKLCMAKVMAKKTSVRLILSQSRVQSACVSTFVVNTRSP